MGSSAPNGPDARASAATLLDQAEQARSHGDLEGMRSALVDGFHAARRAGDTELMARAALALPTSQGFGTHPGQVPGLLHEAYLAASDPTTRARLAAALARAWVYGGDADRAVGFATEAEVLAAPSGDPLLVADALDAALLVRWGPDDFAERVGLAARLQDVAAHVIDTEVRLSAHLWRLTVAWECLDVVAVQRQLRALEVLAAESGSARVAFFAVARRAMYAVTSGDLTQADTLIARTRQLGAEVAEPDVEAVMHSLDADRARQAGDLPTLRAEAASYEAYGTAEGVPSVLAEGAVLWLDAGDADRAAALVRSIAGESLDGVTRDVDFLLTVTSLVEVASAVGLDDLVAAGAERLEPFAGRAVLNAGAVAFHGVVDDYLFQAHRRLADGQAARWRDAAVAGYRRIGARWWERRLGRPEPTPATRSRTLQFHPQASGSWLVGPADAPMVLPDLKGLRHLRQLLARPAVDVPALTLSDLAAGHGGGGLSGSDAGEVLDATAVAAYRRRLADIDAEIDEAAAWADPARREQAEREREALLRELAAATGLAGRHRRSGSSDERARMAVRKAIVAAVRRIDEHDPALARLLRDTVHTGVLCRYEPDPTRPVTWVLDAPGG